MFRDLTPDYITALCAGAEWTTSWTSMTGHAVYWRKRNNEFHLHNMGERSLGGSRDKSRG